MGGDQTHHIAFVRGGVKGWKQKKAADERSSSSFDESGEEIVGEEKKKKKSRALTVFCFSVSLVSPTLSLSLLRSCETLSGAALDG